jgi:MoxR-like ATPase
MTSKPVHITSADKEAALEQFPGQCRRLSEELGRIIVGQHDVVRHVLTAFFVGGHCLLQGVPGLAKTLLVRTLAEALDLRFKRIQFTPDLMPMDILGADVLEEDRATGRREIRFLPGPIFASILLADEINRTPPKTQAALLEAMQEHQVTVGGKGYALPEPFFVLATQNPIEQEGTYLLPEAQLDRFLFLVRMEYPDEEEERQILRLTTAGAPPAVSAVMTADDVLRAQQVVRDVPAPPDVVDYAARLVRASRPDGPGAPEFVRRWVRWGAGPRAGQALILGGKARALMDGRFAVGPQDVRDVALPVMRHRILLNYHAEAEGETPDSVSTRLLQEVPAPGSSPAA